MTTEDLSREIILDHYQNPRNHGRLEHPTLANRGHNPRCGDEIELSLAIDDETIRDIQFIGRGCSISQASASMMTEAVKAKPVEDVQRLVDTFKAMMHGDDVDVEELGDLEALEGVQKFPVRIKCALLAWTTLEEALKEAKH